MSLAYRVIARLDVKGPNLIKGVQFEGLRVLGDPAQFAQRYAEEGADEILYVDTVASLYGRENIAAIVERTAQAVFVPICVAGGVREPGDVRRLLRAGADKVALNSAAIRDPSLIGRCAEYYGSQAICVSVEAKRVGPDAWEAYTDGGREKTGRCAKAWIFEACRRGAGEILLTSIDRDGTRRGADLELAAGLDVPVPVILAGGIGTPEQAVEAAGRADAIAIGAALHNGKTSISAVKAALAGAGKVVR